jgi:hypothetical protein
VRLYQSLSIGLHGALMLARGQHRGLLFMEAGARGVARSFWALPMCLPSVLYMVTLDWRNGALPPHALLILLRQAMVFGAAWLAFAVFSHRIAPRVRRGHLWPSMIVAWNWCQVPENMLLVLGTVPGTLGAPHLVDQVAQVATFGWALWIEWFAIRLAFSAGPLLATWLVMLDQTFGILFLVLDQAVVQAFGAG